jgi:hypothetical protein
LRPDLLASTDWQGCAGSKQGKWNRKSRKTRKWIPARIGVNLLSKRIIGCALTVLQADDIHRARCLNYLRATGLHLCLLRNFGMRRLEIKRIVLAR